MGSRNPNKFSKVERKEQARAAWQLKLDGYSLPQIGQTLGIGKTTVIRRLGAYEASVVIPDIEQYRKIQIERHEDLINALKPHIAAGSVELPYVPHYLKALAQLDAYTGAAMPTKIESTVTIQDSKDAELAELIAMQLAQEALANTHSEAQDEAAEVQTDVQKVTSDNGE